MKIAKITRINHETITTTAMPVLGAGGLFEDIIESGIPLLGVLVVGIEVVVAVSGNSGKTNVTVENGSSVGVELISRVGVMTV